MTPIGTYDAVVVGARCAGSATAMLLARAGARVLLVDRVHPSRDTLSTHALMRAGVLQLERWGLLERIVAAGTPAVTGTTFTYGNRTERVELSSPLYAPRRPLLDTVLFDAALDAGVQPLIGADVLGVTRQPDGRISGVTLRPRGGAPVPVPAGLVVGADGVRSTVARAVGASVLHRGSSAGALVYGYWPMPSPLRPEGSRYRWFYRSRTSAGVIPTNDGSACIWAGLPADAFAERRHLGLAELMGEVLASAAPEIAELVAGHPTPRLFGFPGVPAMLRTPVGPGWALVGDAGWFKDPLTAHGISDALRDAEFLAQAALGGSPAAFRRYQQRRDELSLPLLRAAEPVVGYGWTDDEIPDLLRTESAAMKPEVAALRALDLETRAA